MLCRIFQYPLTKVRFLWYLVHGELLCGGWLLVLLSYHSRVLFCVPAVTYVLYRNMEQENHRDGMEQENHRDGTRKSS